MKTILFEDQGVTYHDHNLSKRARTGDIKSLHSIRTWRRISPSPNM